MSVHDCHGRTTSRHLEESHRKDATGSLFSEQSREGSFPVSNPPASVINFLPLLAARVEGKISDGIPTMLFLCTHNAGARCDCQ